MANFAKFIPFIFMVISISVFAADTNADRGTAKPSAQSQTKPATKPSANPPKQTKPTPCVQDSSTPYGDNCKNIKAPIVKQAPRG